MNLFYADLVEKYQDPSLITYSDLLLVKEWIDKRNIIVNLDGEACITCKNMATEYVKGTGHFWFTVENRIEKAIIFNEDGPKEIEYETESILSETSDKANHLQVHHNY